MHSKGYSNRCSLIRLLRETEMAVESLNCPVDTAIGFVMPRPPVSVVGQGGLVLGH